MPPKRARAAKKTEKAENSGDEGGSDRRAVGGGAGSKRRLTAGAADEALRSALECPVCYEPMHHGVKWNADACVHRFCPACTHRMVFGKPQQTMRVERASVSRESCPMCMRAMKARGCRAAIQ